MTGSEHCMDATSENVTWKSWSQKWGDWTTWFPKMTLPGQSTRVAVGSLQDGVERVRKIRKVTVKAPIAH